MNDFDSVAYQAFLDAAADKYDFTTCQRPDGSKYGSPGRCIKGSETSPASKDDKKSSSKSSGGGGGGDAVAPAPPKSAMTKKDPVASVQKQQKETAALKKQMDKDVTAKAKAGKIKGVSKADVERIQARKAKEKRMKKLEEEEAALKKKYGGKNSWDKLTDSQVRAGGGRLD